MTTVAALAQRPRDRQRRNRRRGLILLVIVLAALVPLSLMVGTIDVSASTAWHALVDFDPTNSEHLLVRHRRLPRTIIAVLVGAALGVAGLIMQALSRNPLADPGILGINAGAALGVAVGLSLVGVTTLSGYLWFALAGAGLAGVVVYLLGGVRRGTDPVRLVLSGTALTAVLLALTHILIVNSPETVYDRFRVWIAGSVQGRGFESLGPVAIIVGIGFIAALTLPRALDAAALGNDLSAALGVKQTRVWAVSAIVVILVAGGATAAAGPLLFIGLAAPHLARFITGPDHRWAMPYVLLVGAVLVLLADVLGRVVAQPGEVGVGIMAALLGGPFFVALVRRRRLAQL